MMPGPCLSCDSCELPEVALVSDVYVWEWEFFFVDTYYI